MSTTLPILAIIFIATFIRSTFGFGEGLVAVPLLALFIPIEVAAPLAVLLSITIALIVVIQDWHRIHLRSAAWLLAPTVIGTPLGLLLLTSPHRLLVKTILGILIIAFAIYSLAGKKPPQLAHDSHPWMLTCGFFAGILGGAFGMNGPPLVIYGAMRRWSPQHFRATLQGYFLPASILAMAGYWYTGLWTPTINRDYLLSLPVAVPAIFLGRYVNHRLHGDSFLKYVYLGLLAIGAALLFQSLHHR